MWTAYLLQKNIQRFRALLDEPTTPEETRRVVKELLADARQKLSALEENASAVQNRPRDGRE